MLKDQQYNHLTSNTPMKLLTTIAAVLISISAFSQDYIEYDNGTFSKNGKELSMEQIDDLTVLHQAGRGNFRRGNYFNRMHKNPNLRGGNNTLNFLGGAATGFYGGIGVLFLMLAYRMVAPSVLAPFVYFGILSSFTFGWAFFGEFPVETLFPGVLLIVGSGALIVWRETRRKIS